MSRMPRLIRDVRRRRFVDAVIVFVIVGVGLLVGSGVFCHFRDKLRGEIQQEIVKTESRLERINELSRTAFSRLCGDWINSVECISAHFKQPMQVQTEVGFLALPSSWNCRGNMPRLTNEYGIVTRRLANCRNAFSEVVDRGRLVVARMDDLSKKVECQNIASASSELLLFRDSLRETMDSSIELFLRRANWKLAVSQIDDVWKSTVAMDEWKSRLSLLMEYQGLTNKLHEIDRNYSSTVDQLMRVAKEFVESTRSIDVKRAILCAKLEEYDGCFNEVVKSMDERRQSLGRLEGEIEKTMKYLQTELDELRRQHGSYVNAEVCEGLFELEKESVSLKLSLRMRIGSAFLSVSNEAVRLRKICTEIISVTNALAKVGGTKDKGLDEICQAGMELARKMDFANLRKEVKAFHDTVQESAESAGALVKRGVSALARIKEALRDWGPLDAKIKAERKSLAEESRSLSGEVEFISRRLGECRADDETILNSLNATCREVAVELRTTETLCAERVVCTNGVSAEMSIQDNEKIKNALGLLQKKLCSLKGDMEKRLLDMSLYRLEYQRDSLVYVAGSRKIEFAIEVERAGVHRISIQLEKRRGNYLFRSLSRHDVKILGTLSDGSGKVYSIEKYMKDTTADWVQFELAYLESKCTAGKNCFSLDLEFSSGGHDAQSGEWRFDLLDFAVLIDGSKTDNVYRIKRL